MLLGLVFFRKLLHHKLHVVLLLKQNPPEDASLEALLVDGLSQITAPLSGAKYSMSPCFRPAPWTDLLREDTISSLWLRCL